VCSGVPWRREPDGCPACKQPFALERPFTINDVMQRPSEYRGIEP
jgi:hypothetical protein